MASDPSQIGLDPARIRFITTRFDDLQGLRRVGMALVMLGFAGSGRMLSLDGFELFAMVVPFLFVGYFSERWCTRYYERRFGRVRAASSGGQDAGKWRGFWGGVIFFVGSQMDRLHGGSGIPSVTIALLGAMPLWHIIRDWPHRPHLLLDVCGAALASALFASVRPSGQTDDWIWQYYLTTGFPLFGVFSALAGMLNHRLLVRSLPGRAECVEREKHAGSI